jgi:sec-independent protein translocase protein TatA
MAGLTGWHFLIVLAVILLLFGATKLPALAKGLGESMRIFKTEIKKDDGVKPAPDQGASSSNRTTSGVSDSYDAPDSSPKP